MNRRRVRVLLYAVVALYAAPLLVAGLRMRFAPDDMMNLYKYWHEGYVRTALANLQFWSTFYRPMGGLFYLTIFPWAGLDPLPYRIGLMLVLVANALLACRAALLVLPSRWLATLAAVLAWFNADSFDTHYVTASLYDVLCYGFYLGGFVVWAGARRRGGLPTARRTAAVAALYVAAMNAKEMGVTLPLILACYEVAWRGWRALAERRVVLPLALLAALGAIYSAGKMTGPNSLRTIGAYEPVFTLGRFLDNNAGFASELVFHDGQLLQKAGILALWGVFAYLGLRRRDPALRFATLFVILASLPIAFIPRRGGSSLYLLWFGYAIALAAIAGRLIRFLSREPLFRWTGVQPVFARLGLTAALIVYCFAGMQQARAVREPILLKEQAFFESIIRQVAELNPHPRDGAKILFRNDPFEQYDMYFIAALTYRNPSAEIIVERLHPAPVDPATADHVFVFEGGRLVRRR